MIQDIHKHFQKWKHKCDLVKTVWDDTAIYKLGKTPIQSGSGRHVFSQECHRFNRQNNHEARLTWGADKGILFLFQKRKKNTIGNINKRENKQVNKTKTLPRL